MRWLVTAAGPVVEHLLEGEQASRGLTPRCMAILPAS